MTRSMAANRSFVNSGQDVDEKEWREAEEPNTVPGKPAECGGPIFAPENCVAQSQGRNAYRGR
jgi:hypothetical protein